ncbi:MAG: ZIP family metal transporter [Burkholderiales bacterium]
MGPLAYITIATVLGGVASSLAAALVSLAARKEWIGSLVSFAVGAMLGAAFLEILPHAFERSTNFQGLAATVLAGICGFFLLEKLVIWRHHHHSIEEAANNGDQAPSGAKSVAPSAAHSHGHHHPHAQAADVDGGRSGFLILVGDSFHNFVDGVLIAAAFLESIPLGIVTATAVIAHEIPQEVGDFVILLHSGYTRGRALLLNLISSLAMLVGGLLGYVALNEVREWLNPILAIAAASMIYIAVADLIPGLHKRHELRATATQVSLIALGVLMIWGVGLLTHG